MAHLILCVAAFDSCHESVEDWLGVVVVEDLGDLGTVLELEIVYLSEVAYRSTKHPSCAEFAFDIPVVQNQMSCSRHRARRLAKRSDLRRVSSELADVLLNPSESDILVLQKQIGNACIGHFLGREVSKEIQAVIR